MKKLILPKNNITLSAEQARVLSLNSQGLLGHNFGKSKDATLKIIEHLGYIQIDTLSVVSRSHHHTLWSRIPDYNENFLHELLEKDKSVYEYWSHAASYLPMKDYRFSLIRKNSYNEGKSHWFSQDQKIKKYVLDRIKSEGALQSKDFEYKREIPAGWYDWKPTKRALEQLFMEGKLMVAKRKGFQKVYDLTENVLPSNIDTSLPTQEEYLEHLIYNSVKSHGIVQENEIIYLRNGLKSKLKKILNELQENNKLTTVNIEGLDKMPFITTPKHLESIDRLNSENNINFLSPFDNAVIQRKRLKLLFDFDYIIECYLPEEKRKYGYFSLPVLYNNKFVGRFDPKADRKNKIFYIKSLYFEEIFKPDEVFKQLFLSKLRDFAIFNGCEKIIIEKADDKWELNSFSEACKNI